MPSVLPSPPPGQLLALVLVLQVLILSDEHPNVVRCFAMEEDREFVYLALERCRATLCDWLATPQVSAVARRSTLRARGMAECAMPHWALARSQPLDLAPSLALTLPHCFMLQGRKAFVEPLTQQPTQRCLDAMAEVVAGLAALHERGIVHRGEAHGLLRCRGRHGLA